MSEEVIFSPSRVNISNISELTEKQTRLEERRLCELAELARMAAELTKELVSSGMNILEVLSLLSDSPYSPAFPIHSDVLTDNRDRISNYIRALNILDKAMFCDLYRERLFELGISVTEDDFLPRSPSGEKFVYVKNVYADEAYDVFSQDFSDPRVRYAESFKDALRLVVEGEVTYSLLPLEERGGRLPTISQLIFSGDLKINSVTPVFGFDGSADMKYALVSKGFTVPSVHADDDRYLEIRVAQEPGVNISELILAAENYGDALYRINTVFFDTEEGRIQYYSLIFKDVGKDFSSLLTFLTLFITAYVPVGIYKNLE